MAEPWCDTRRPSLKASMHHCAPSVATRRSSYFVDPQAFVDGVYLAENLREFTPPLQQLCPNDPEGTPKSTRPTGLQLTTQLCPVVALALRPTWTLQCSKARDGWHVRWYLYCQMQQPRQRDQLEVRCSTNEKQ